MVSHYGQQSSLACGSIIQLTPAAHPHSLNTHPSDPMRALFFLQTVFVLLAVGAAFPQATAEAALANGHAAAATAKVGGILTESLNHANSKIGNSLKPASPAQPAPRAIARPARSAARPSAPPAPKRVAKLSIQSSHTSASTPASTHFQSKAPATPLSIQGGCASNTAADPSRACPN